MDISRELARLNNTTTILKVLVRDVKEYVEKENKSDFGTVLHVETAISELDEAAESIRKIDENK